MLKNRRFRFGWEALFEKFGDMRRRQRRMLGALVHASCFSGAAIFYLLGDTNWILLTPMMYIVSIAAYIPLTAYLRRMDHHRVENRLLKARRCMDNHETALLRDTMDKVRPLQSLVIIAGLGYGMYAFTEGWPLPETKAGWGPIIFTAAWLFIYSLPTVVAVWIDRDDHLEESPIFEDLD